VVPLFNGGLIAACVPAGTLFAIAQPFLRDAASGQESTTRLVSGSAAYSGLVRMDMWVITGTCWISMVMLSSRL
jgi:hypothetical protein